MTITDLIELAKGHPDYKKGYYHYEHKVVGIPINAVGTKDDVSNRLYYIVGQVLWSQGYMEDWVYICNHIFPNPHD